MMGGERLGRWDGREPRLGTEADDAVEVDRVDNPLEPAGPAMVSRDLPPGMADAQQIAGDYHAHGFTDQPPWHRIGIAIDLNDAIRLHLAHQLACHLKRANLSDRAQRASLGAPKALNRRLAGRAVHPLIGDLARPSVEMDARGRRSAGARPDPRGAEDRKSTR